MYEEILQSNSCDSLDRKLVGAILNWQLYSIEKSIFPKHWIWRDQSLLPTIHIRYNQNGGVEKWNVFGLLVFRRNAWWYLCEWHLCRNIFALRIWRNKVYILKKKIFSFCVIIMGTNFYAKTVRRSIINNGRYLLLINFEVNFVWRDSIVCWPTHLWLVLSLTLIWTNFWENNGRTRVFLLTWYS